MQSNKTIVIIGGGPRGLACAIEALNEFKHIYIIDSNPVDSWSVSSTIANFQLRSPVSFDLVTYTDKRDWSLSTFLYQEDIKFTTQKDIEADSRRLNRLDFYNYLCWIKYRLQNNNVSFIYDKVLNIDVNNNNVHSSKGKINFDSLILAQGTIEKSDPANINKYKKIDNKDLFNNDYKSLLVIGSGQGAYDLASHLYQKGTRVGLYITKDAKISQYPAPDYTIWNTRTALGNYCSSLLSIKSKERYINNVKQWGPSITPNNEFLLSTIPIYKDVNIDEVMNKYDNRYISRIGVKPINILNINPLDIDNNFKLIGSNNIYITGPLSILYDGPRSNSIISSSSTAIKIIKDIRET